MGNAIIQHLTIVAPVIAVYKLTSDREINLCNVN